MKNSKGLVIGAVILSFTMFLTGCSDHTSAVRSSSKKASVPKCYTYSIEQTEPDIKKLCEWLMPDYNTANLPTMRRNGATPIDHGEETLMVGMGIVDYHFNSQFSSLLAAFDRINDSSSKYPLSKSALHTKQDFLQKARQYFHFQKKQTLIFAAGCEISVADLQKKFRFKNTSLSPDEKLIYLEFALNEHGLPVQGMNEQQQSFASGDVVFGVRPYDLSVIISDGRILYLNQQNQYTVKSQKSSPIISKEEAIAIAQKDNSADSAQDFPIKRCFLEYVQIPDWKSKIERPSKLIPYWCIEYQDPDEEDTGVESGTRINATTGGNLSYGL